jgi:hypothetical protein
MPNPRPALGRFGGRTRGGSRRSVREDRHKSTVWEGLGAIKHRSLLIWACFIARNAVFRQSVVQEE